MGLGGYLTNGLLRILREDFKPLKLRIAYRKNRKHYAACHRGPSLLFLIYINDICTSSNILKFYIFADDTNLLHADNNLKNLEKTCNKELAKVSSWLIANKLTLNISKSNFVIFRPYQKKITYQPTIKLFDNNSQRLVNLESAKHTLNI